MKRLLAVLLIFLFITGCGNKNTDITYNPTEGTEKTQTQNTEKEIVLYFSNQDASHLVPKTQKVPEDKAGDAQYILSKLFSGSDDENLVNAVPEETDILSCDIQDGVCTVDLSGDFLKESGTASQRMAIYSIVNTLCEIDNVEKVQFLINGEKVMIFGDYIFDEPFEADMTIVKE